MQEGQYDERHALEADFWWFAGMRLITRSILPRDISGAPPRFLDVGCGTGIILLWIARTLRPGLVVGCDYASAALDYCKITLRDTGTEAQVTRVLSQGDV